MTGGLIILAAAGLAAGVRRRHGRN
jgi:uncharacterized protein (TIGR03382 family)